MKKLFSVVLSVLLIVSSLHAFTISGNSGFITVYGYADNKIWVQVDTLTSLNYGTGVSNGAFDILGTDVSPVSDYASNPGYQIGKWTVFASSATVSISFKVSPLKWYADTSKNVGTNSSAKDINYYLQVAYPKKIVTTATSYYYDYGLWPVYSDSTDRTLTLDSSLGMNKDFYIVNDAYLYVRLATQQDEIEVNMSDYPNGYYRSTIIVTITGSD